MFDTYDLTLLYDISVLCSKCR